MVPAIYPCQYIHVDVSSKLLYQIVNHSSFHTCIYSETCINWTSQGPFVQLIIIQVKLMEILCTLRLYLKIGLFRIVVYWRFGVDRFQCTCLIFLCWHAVGISCCTRQRPVFLLHYDWYNVNLIQHILLQNQENKHNCIYKPKVMWCYKIWWFNFVKMNEWPKVYLDSSPLG